MNSKTEGKNMKRSLKSIITDVRQYDACNDSWVYLIFVTAMGLVLAALFGSQTADIYRDPGREGGTIVIPMAIAGLFSLAGLLIAVRGIIEMWKKAFVLPKLAKRTAPSAS
jgi:hypothetical protein